MNYPETGPEFTTPQSHERFEMISKLLLEASSLITEVRAESNPTTSCYTIPLIDGDLIEIPELVRKALPSPDSLIVTIQSDTSQDKSNPACISYDFLSSTEQISITRDGTLLAVDTDEADSLIAPHPAGTPDTHEVFTTRLSSIGHVPDAELNALLFSVIYPDPERGYKLVDTVSFHTPEVIELIKEALKPAAIEVSEVSLYDFSSNDLAHLTYSEVNGEVTGITIQYVDQLTDRVIHVISESDRDFNLRFFTYEDQERTPFYPSTEDIAAVTDLLQAELAVASQADVTNRIIDGVDENSPEKKVVDEGAPIYSARFTQDVLDQLSFDPTNPGA